jgi:hypothetical protein
MSCISDSDCANDLSCQNGQCIDRTKVKTTLYFILGVVIIFVIIVVYGLISLKQDPKSKYAHIRFYGTISIGIALVYVIVKLYTYIKSLYTPCLSKPYDIVERCAKEGKVPYCGSVTGYSWDCVQSGKICEAKPDDSLCKNGSWQCDSSTGYEWKCQEHNINICKTTQPPDIKCGSWICDEVTNYKWVCAKCSSDVPRLETCPTEGEIPICNQDTNNLWKCTPQSKVCPPAPSDFTDGGKCPSPNPFKPRKLTCNSSTNFKWVCSDVCKFDQEIVDLLHCKHYDCFPPTWKTKCV